MSNDEWGGQVGKPRSEIEWPRGKDALPLKVGKVIRRRLGRQGPHLIRTSDGHEYPVRHPEFVLIGRFNVVVEEEDGGIEIVDPHHVVAIRKAPTDRRKNSH